MYIYVTFAKPHNGRSYSRAVGYSRGLPPLKRQGSHEREITGTGAGNNFGYNFTNALIPYLGNILLSPLPIPHS